MYEFTSLFLYKFQFLAELLIAESMIVFRMKRKSMFALRAILSILVCFGMAFAVPILAYNAFYCAFMFILLFGFTVVALKVCFNENWGTIVFYAIAGYAVQHIAYQIFDLVIVLTGLNGGMPMGNYGDSNITVPDGDENGIGGSIFTSNIFVIILWAFIYFETYLLGYAFISKAMVKDTNYGHKNLELFVVVIIIMLSDIIFSSFVTYYNAEHYDEGYVCLLYVYNIFCALLSVYIQFGFSARKKLETDYETINRLWEQKKAQYELTKENIDLINIKCHDLKHQIRKIGRRSEIDSDTLKEMTDVIEIYDSIVKTENEALDIILTEKSLLCNRHDIRLACIADGKALSFMSNADLYSLFGNLIDNAIEAVKDLPKEQRSISLSVKVMKSFLCVNIHNYYKGELKFNGILPLTTKGDTVNHGYGMKSIRFICDKYNGELTIATNDDIFNLNIVFPR